jgi:hypothetical protein
MALQQRTGMLIARNLTRIISSTSKHEKQLFVKMNSIAHAAALREP